MIAAIVVSYHPQVDQLFENIRTYSDSVERILLWRNSPEEMTVPADLAEKIVWMGNGQNAFMAKPLNTALAWCETNGYKYLLTMDQDSQWINARQFLSKAIAASEKDVAIYAPHVIGQYDQPTEDFDAESVITSGSLVNVEIAQSLGGFREDYQIYWVDGEYCYWARTNGFRIRILHDCKLRQQFGRQTRTLFGFTTSNYSANVYYLLIRNMLWMKREYPKGLSLKTVLYTLLYNTRGILLGEKEKFKKLYHISKGIVHGLFSHFDRRSSSL